MQENVKLSIIMPCYNVASTIRRALDSIFMQRVNFEYEIIAVDDASEDQTLDILQEYASLYRQIRIIKNQTNSGNAMSFYNGLSASQGDYFCVLDGDDYYALADKLQRQVSFLENDSAEEYVAAAHYYIIDLGDGQLHIPDYRLIKEFTYVDFMTQNSGYYHTSTYMYRNIFRGNIPEFFKSSIFRGDTPRTTFHLMYSNKKVKVLDFVGSVYTFSYTGIWTRMKEKAQFEYQVNYYNKLKEVVHSSFEERAIDKIIDINTRKGEVASSSETRKYLTTDIDSCLRRIQRYCKRYAFAEREYIFQSVYYSEFVDSLCSAIGYIYRVYHSEIIQTEVVSDNIGIVICALNPKGGGIFREVTEIIEMYADKNVYLFVTEMEALNDTAIEILGRYGNVTTICPPNDCSSKLGYLYTAFKRVSPEKAYYYASHSDSYAQALMQMGLCKNVTLFSYDHGFICGISNPNIDCIIAKRPSDYTILTKKFGKKVIYIPTWNSDIYGCEGMTYKPFFGHEKLITASGAARFYKLDGRQPYSYLDLILELLSTTGGIHFHFGPMPSDKLEYVRSYLQEHGLPEDAFQYVEWAENVPFAVLENHVDIFIEPFPIVSYKLTLDMLSCGVPVFAFNGYSRMEKLDFIYSGNLLWNTKEDFITKLGELNADILNYHSKRSKSYFDQTHAIGTIKPYFITETEFGCPDRLNITDNYMQDIRDYIRLYGDAGKIQIMKPDQWEEKRLREDARNKAEKRAPIQTEKMGCIEAERACSQQKNQEIERLIRLKSSWSYRTGTIIIWIPKHLIKFIKLCKQKGFGAFQIKNYDETLKDTSAEYNRIKRSWTMIIGRTVTFIPRLVFNVVVKTKKHGFRYTIRALKNKLLKVMV